MDDTGEAGPVEPTGLQVGHRTTPNNHPSDEPVRFSWRVDDPGWGGGQSAYRVRVARSRDALAAGDTVWDSGRVDDARSTGARWDGRRLEPDETYYWTVRVWNEEGEASAVAGPVAFATAPGEEWRGEWVAHQPGPGDTNGYRGRWRAPDAGPEWVQVDLGADRTFDRVELHPTEPFDGPTTPDGQTLHGRTTEDTYRAATVAQGPVAFGFPDGYRVEAAGDADFESARTLVDHTGGDPAEPGREAVVHDVGAVTARYLRVTATDLDAFAGGDDRLREEQRPWAVFALAALAVRDGDGADLARDATVTASSSVESAHWGRDGLVDGAYTASMASESPLLRTDVTLSKPVARARAHFAGVGYGELHVNGEKVGDAVLDPGWTEYDERVLYRTHDVGDLLREGDNAVGVWLGRGWFAKSTRQWSAGGSPRARLRLTVEYEDGTTREITTGGDWTADASPVVANDIYHGETYDARLEQDGWATPGFDDDDWDSAAVVDGPAGTLSPQRTEPIEVTDTLEPVALVERDDGVVVDFGQNHAGWVAIDVTGDARGADDEGDTPAGSGEPGDEVVLRHAEILDGDGDLETTDLRTAEATDTYVLRGEGAESYEPRFTYHGYRYVHVSDYPGELTADDVRSKVVHTAMDRTGAFDCSDDDLAAVQRNAQWGLRSNAHGVPTDCPQRDERQGFSGDGHIAGPALHYNFDADRFHAKWARDHGDCQSPHGYVPSKLPFGAPPAMIGPSWTVSRVVVPWHLYCFYGDEAALEANYEGMRRYVDFYHDAAEDDLLPEAHTCYGDWVALENADGRVGEPTELFTNAYYYRATSVLARAAEALGYDAEAARHGDRAAAIEAAFSDRFFDADRATYGPGTQASNAVPRFFGLVPDGRGRDVATALARTVRDDDASLRTGFLGTRALLGALTEYGYADLAYEIASHPEFPGWVYMLRNGATTMWERWDSDDRVGDGMNSFNHSPFTCVSEWFYRGLAGIAVSESLPEARTVDISPSFVDALDRVAGTVGTPWGEIRSRWTATADGHELSVTIPWNLDGRVAFPVGDDGAVALDGTTVWADGGPVASPDGVRSLDRARARVVVTVGAGTHRFDVR